MYTTNKSCWIITEGIAGTENQCIGIAEALGVKAVIKRIKLRSPWLELSPWLRCGHRYALAKEGDRIDPPYPDILIASGRKSIGIALHIKKASGGKTFLVQIQDPRINPACFDLVVVPEHDKARGDNVLVISGAVHRVTPERISAEKSKFEHLLNHLPHPRVAVLIGGNSKSHKMTPENAQRLTGQLLALDAGLMITTSRRTGEENTRILREKLNGGNIFFWDSSGDNPYFAMLGLADYIIVTEDSVSMASEVISTGKPVYIAKLEGGNKKFDRFHQALEKKGCTRPFTGQLEPWSYIPPNDTIAAAKEIRRRMKLKG